MGSACRVSRMAAWLAIISDTTSDAPRRFTMRRNGRSVTPDIGARITGSSIATEPRLMLIVYSKTGFAQNLGRYSNANVVAVQHLLPVYPPSSFGAFHAGAPLARFLWLGFLSAHWLRVCGCYRGGTPPPGFRARF